MQSFSFVFAWHYYSKVPGTRPYGYELYDLVADGMLMLVTSVVALDSA
jgi:hypothetical protein